MVAPVNNNKRRKYRIPFREGAVTAAAGGFLNEGMIRSCRIFAIFPAAMIFSLRSEPKFAKSNIAEQEAPGACPVCGANGKMFRKIE